MALAFQPVSVPIAVGMATGLRENASLAGIASVGQMGGVMRPSRESVLTTLD
jgi:hypothetical protein